MVQEGKLATANDKQEEKAPELILIQTGKLIVVNNEQF